MKNRFSAHVYETHARIALESGDLSEYNQCQSCLQGLKNNGISISSDEFDCYRVLHAFMQHNKMEVISTLKDIVQHSGQAHISDEVLRIYNFAMLLTINLYLGF